MMFITQMREKYLSFFDFLLYWIKARSKYDIHSPFVYKIYSQVLKDRTRYPAYQELKKKYPKIRNGRYYRLLYRLSKYFNPGTIYFVGNENGAEGNYLNGAGDPKKNQKDLLKLSGTIELGFIDLEAIEVRESGYFSRLLQHTANDSVLIIWNLRRSKNCYNIWKEIIQSGKVIVTIDIFQLGLIFFREELSKEDFILNF